MRVISAMGVSPWFRCLELIPGFGRSEANREMKDSPKRLDGNFSLRIHVFFVLNRIVHIENIRLKPVANVGVFTDDLCFDRMRLMFISPNVYHP